MTEIGRPQIRKSAATEEGRVRRTLLSTEKDSLYEFKCYPTCILHDSLYQLKCYPTCICIRHVLYCTICIHTFMVSFAC